MIEILDNGRHRRRVIFEATDKEYHEAWKALTESHNPEDYMYMGSQESERPLWIHSFKHVKTRMYIHSITTARANA